MWCEDFSSGFVFWSKVFETLFQGYIVESKKNNSELCKAISKLDNADDKYYVLMDNAVDNPDVLREKLRLYEVIKEKPNVTVIDIHCFEFVLLSFTKLEKWIFAAKDSLKDKRSKIIEAKNAFVDIIRSGADASRLSVVKEELNYADFMNSEQMSARLLYEITRNTGFETTKGKLGDCFIVDCCDCNTRMPDDICGLDQERITMKEKIKEIFENSVMREAFLKVGL